MNHHTFEGFRDFIRTHSGIELGAAKQALLQARIRRRMHALSIEDPAEYLRHLNGGDAQELVVLIDSISTNVTSFFREPSHFEDLARHLRDLHARGSSRFRIWSAACSGGDEPYSIAMTAADAVPLRSVDLKILATDIATHALREGQLAAYSEARVAPVPQAARLSYLQRLPGAEPRYTIHPDLKRLVSFRRLNLSRPPFPMKGNFDAIFCRNVMIYFGVETRAALVREMARLLSPGGLLIVGHTESILGLVEGLEPVRPSVYRKL